MSYSQDHLNAWDQLNLEDRIMPPEVFPRVNQQSFDDLQKRYLDTFGYYIRIPGLEDIIHWKPNAFKTPAEIKAEKIDGLMRVLASPQYGAQKWYSTIMTWMDDIQDAGSIVYPAISMLNRWFPKIFGKLLPVAGWLMLGTDLLQFLISLGRLRIGSIAQKRVSCAYVRINPFGKIAQHLRKERIRHYKPGLADLLQVAQTTDNITGVGLSLGAIPGFIMDAIAGGLRYASGDKVSIGFDVPNMFDYERTAGRGVTTAPLISSMGQTFSEDMHLFTYLIGATSARLFSPWAHETDIAGTVDRVTDIMLPAARPTQQSTIEVIKDARLNVEDGVGWPYNGGKEIPLGELWDALMPATRDTFRDWSVRHRKDWWGYTTATVLDAVTTSNINAFDPTGDVEYDDTPEMKTAFRMIKGGLMPTALPSEKQGLDFMNWINRSYYDHGSTPGLFEIEEALKRYGIPYQTSPPAPGPQEPDEYWPANLDLTPFTFG